MFVESACANCFLCTLFNAHARQFPIIRLSLSMKARLIILFSIYFLQIIDEYTYIIAYSSKIKTRRVECDYDEMTRQAHRLKECSWLVAIECPVALCYCLSFVTSKRMWLNLFLLFNSKLLKKNSDLVYRKYIKTINSKLKHLAQIMFWPGEKRSKAWNSFMRFSIMEIQNVYIELINYAF